MQELPQYSLEIQQLQIRSGGGNKPIEVDLSIRCGLVDRHDNSKAKKLKRREINMTVVYAVTSDLDFIVFRRTSYVCTFRFSPLPFKFFQYKGTKGNSIV